MFCMMIPAKKHKWSSGLVYCSLIKTGKVVFLWPPQTYSNLLLFSINRVRLSLVLGCLHADNKLCYLHTLCFTKMSYFIVRRVLGEI